MTARHALPLALALSVFALPALASDDDRAAPMSRDWSTRAEVTDAARGGADASAAMRSDDRSWKVERDEDEDRDHDRAERGAAGGGGGGGGQPRRWVPAAPPGKGKRRGPTGGRLPFRPLEEAQILLFSLAMSSTCSTSFSK